MQKLKTVFLFSGQGSQYRGMGKVLYENNAVFKASMDASEALIVRQTGQSMLAELYEAGNGEFDDLLVTHPAIVAIELAMLDLLTHKGITPDFIAGNSLGEFAAGVAGGVWEAQHAIEAAITQAKSIEQAGVEGGMLAVINQEGIAIGETYKTHGLYLASNNFKGHFTVSGPKQGLDAYQKELDQLGVQFFRLPVHIPFHTPLINHCFQGFDLFMATSSPLKLPKPGFVSSISSTALSVLPENYFMEAVSGYSNYPNLVQYLEQRGPCLYIDLGPSGTSATFVKYNLAASSASETLQIMTNFRRELVQLDRLDKIFGAMA